MPSTLATCEIYGTIFDVFGAPVAGAVVGCMAVYKNGALVLSRTLEVQSDADGYFTIDLPRGPDCVAILYANTPGLNISALGTPTAIPDADSAELVSIIGDYNLWDQVPVAIPIGAGVSSFNGRTGAVVLTSADVTTALGYTPGTPPGGITGDIQLNSGGVFGPSSMQQFDADTIVFKSPLTENVSGAAEAAGIRIMDVDDGAGNAQWFGLYPTYGAMNFRWEHTGTGLASREFYVYNGVSLFIMAGEWRGGHDEGHYVAMQTSDAAAGGSMNAINIAGEHQVTGWSPGIYFRAHCLNTGAFGSNRYNYYMDDLGLNLPADPTLAMHAATRQWVLAQIGAIPAGGVTSFNSRTGGVVPLTGDYAAFYAALIHTHTRSEITDLGIFSTSQPGLVPQPTAGDAAKVLSGAGTWVAQAAGGGGGSPAGSATEIQYRFDAATFGALPGSGFSSDTLSQLTFFGSCVRVKGQGTSGGPAFARLELRPAGTAGSVLYVAEPTDAVPAMSIFYAINTAASPRNLYFGRQGLVATNRSPMYMMFYTGAVGNEDVRRLFISPNGSVVINQQTLADSTYALTANASGNTAFAKAFSCQGFADFGTPGSGFQVGTLGRIGICAASSESTTLVNCLLQSGITSWMYVSDGISSYAGFTLNSPALGTGGPALSFYSNGTLDFAAAGAATQVSVTGTGLTILAGDVTLFQDPTLPLHAVTKSYVDTHGVSAGVASFNTRTGAVTLSSSDVTGALAYTPVNKAGDTMAGLLTLSGDPSGVLDAVPKQYADLRLLKAGDTMTGALTMTNASIIQNSAAGGALTIGVNEELLTLSTVALTTDTVGNLLPAGSIILSVTGRVTTTINPGTNWKMGDATVADRFSAVSTALTAGSTVVGINSWVATRTTAGMGADQAAAAKVRVTMTGTQPTAGAIRITVRYITLAAATS